MFSDLTEFFLSFECFDLLPYLFFGVGEVSSVFEITLTCTLFLWSTAEDEWCYYSFGSKTDDSYEANIVYKPDDGFIENPSML